MISVDFLHGLGKNFFPHLEIKLISVINFVKEGNVQGLAIKTDFFAFS